jgi:hypothetical protein
MDFGFEVGILAAYFWQVIANVSSGHFSKDSFRGKHAVSH